MWGQAKSSLYIIIIISKYSYNYFIFLVPVLQKDGCTALYVAAQEGNLPAVQLLLDKGADIEAKDKVGQTLYRNIYMNAQIHIYMQVYIHIYVIYIHYIHIYVIYTLYTYIYIHLK